jgi:hypothetical protein
VKRLNLGARLLGPDDRCQAGLEARRVGEQVFCDVVQDLGAPMRRGAAPGAGLDGGFHGVADVLAVAFGHDAQQLAASALHLTAVARVGPRLRAADIELGGAVDGRTRGRRCGRLATRLGRRGGHGRAGLQVLDQAFPPALAAEAAFAHAAKAASRVEQVGAVDPHHARIQTCGHFHSLADGLAPHGSRQPVGRVVGQLDGLGRGAEGLHAQHRAEDLVANDL